MDWMLSLLLLCLVLLVCFLLASLWMYRRLQLVLTLHHQQQQALRHDLDVFIDGSLGLGRTLADLEKRMAETAKRQTELEQSDPHDKSYLQAAKMLTMGAAIHDIMETCQLSQAEAELMQIMQKSQQQAWEELESSHHEDDDT